MEAQLHLLEHGIRGAAAGAAAMAGNDDDELAVHAAVAP